MIICHLIISQFAIDKKTYIIHYDDIIMSATYYVGNDRILNMKGAREPFSSTICRLWNSAENWFNCSSNMGRHEFVKWYDNCGFMVCFKKFVIDMLTKNWITTNYLPWNVNFNLKKKEFLKWGPWDSWKLVVTAVDNPINPLGPSNAYIRQ